MDGKVLQRLKKEEEQASEMKDSNAIKFKGVCCHQQRQNFFPGTWWLSHCPPPEHRQKRCLFKGAVKKMPHPSTAVSELDEQTGLQVPGQVSAAQGFLTLPQPQERYDKATKAQQVSLADCSLKFQRVCFSVGGLGRVEPRVKNCSV